MNQNQTPCLSVKEAVPYLSVGSWNEYERWKAVKEEKKRLNARIAELDYAASQLDHRMAAEFEESGGIRRLPGNLILKREEIVVDPKIATQAMVGAVIIKGYSYPRYEEVQL